MGHGALRVDEGRNVEVLVAAEVRGGAVQQQQGETLEVVVGGADRDGQTRHAGHQAQDVLGVGTVFAQYLQQTSDKWEVEEELQSTRVVTFTPS